MALREKISSFAVGAASKANSLAVEAAAQAIRALDPNPVGAWAVQGETEYLRPDAWVAEIDGTLQIFVNQWDLPQFHLSPAYLQMAREDPGGEAADYLRQKIQQARWVLQCVRRRQETLTRCLTALVAAQEDFFRGRTSVPGPLLGRELAETLGLQFKLIINEQQLI